MKILRWVLFLPASIVGMFIAYWFAILQSMIVSNTIGGGWDWELFNSTHVSWGNVVNWALTNGFSGAGFVFAGCYVAPVKSKTVLSIILCVLCAFISGGSIALSLYSMEGLYTRDVISIIASTIGAVAVAIGYYKYNGDTEELLDNI